MTNFEYLKSLSLDDLAEWLDTHGQFDGSPWLSWFDKTYCKNCESIKCNIEDKADELGFKPPWLGPTIECAYCELEKKCKFFPELSEEPDNKEILKMWLNIKKEEDR